MWQKEQGKPKRKVFPWFVCSSCCSHSLWLSVLTACCFRAPMRLSGAGRGWRTLIGLRQNRKIMFYLGIILSLLKLVNLNIFFFLPGNTIAWSWCYVCKYCAPPLVFYWNSRIDTTNFVCILYQNSRIQCKNGNKKKLKHKSNQCKEWSTRVI